MQTLAPSWRRLAELAIGVCIVAITLQTWCALGVLWPIEVSAGSMAPTILGPHRAAACPACGYKFACGLDWLPSDEIAACPNCGERPLALDASPNKPGQRMIVDRTAWLWREPRRWEPIIFADPSKLATREADSLVLKRIVGRPGETVSIRDGDIWIDGHIARKSLAEADAMRIVVHDDSFRRSASGDDANATRSPGWIIHRAAGSRWKQTTTGYSCDANDRSKGDWLAFQSARGHDIDDEDPYNAALSRRLNPVTDVGIEARIQIEGAHGAVSLTIETRGGRFTANLMTNGQGIAIVMPGKPAPIIVSQSLPASGGLVSWRYVDRQTMLSIDGRLIGVWDDDTTPGTERSTVGAQVSISADRCSAKIDDLIVFRDVHYLPSVAGARLGKNQAQEPLRPGEYFVLGDNSPISIDSRSAEFGPIRKESLIGRPLGW